MDKRTVGRVIALVCENKVEFDEWALKNMGDILAHPTCFPVAMLQEIQIEPSERGYGLATPAIKKCIEACKDRGCTVFFLNAVKQESSPLTLNDLVEWYQRIGFNIVGESRHGKYMMRVLSPSESAESATQS
jgi:GNAT superfamily N-acetyltransferase